MTRTPLDDLVDRFLGWKLPEDFSPDGGISFKPIFNEGTPHQFRNTPTGTNLFHAGQAKAMLEYVLGDMLADLQTNAHGTGQEQGAKDERERILAIVRAVEEEADLDTEHGVGWSQACRSIDNRITQA